MHALDTRTLPDIYVTAPDLARLRELVARALDQGAGEAAEQLEQELERARVVEADQLPPDVVGMRSRVRFRDQESGRTREVSLVYPHEAVASAGKLSVLAPAGVALLGLRAGATIRWPMPRGRTATLELLEVEREG